MPPVQMSSGGEERRRVEGGCGRINEVTETVARPVIGGPWWSDYSILPMQRFPVVSPTVTLSSPNSKLRYPVPSGLHAPTASPAATLFPSPSRSTLPLPLPSILPLEHSPVASLKHSPPYSSGLKRTCMDWDGKNYKGNKTFWQSPKYAKLYIKSGLLQT